MKRADEKFKLVLKDKELTLIEDALTAYARCEDTNPKESIMAYNIINKLYSEAYN